MKNADTVKGFTLLEVVVAISIFGIFIAMMMSIFTRFLTTQRQEIAQQALQEDIHYALETFNREVRTAYGSTFTTVDGDQIFFRNQNGSCVQYAFSDNAMKRGEASGAGSECREATYTLAPLTSRDTFMAAGSRFDPAPAAVTDGVLTTQGFVTVIMNVTSRRATLLPLLLQSTITSQQVIPYE